jgi:hypothetical protein
MFAVCSRPCQKRSVALVAGVSGVWYAHPREPPRTTPLFLFSFGFFFLFPYFEKIKNKK